MGFANWKESSAESYVMSCEFCLKAAIECDISVMLVAEVEGSVYHKGKEEESIVIKRRQIFGFLVVYLRTTFYQ